MKKMKTTTTVILSAAVLLSSSVLFAETYFPPERIQCKQDNQRNVTCQGFDAQYLMIGGVDGVNNLSDRRITLNFLSGRAIYKGGLAFSYQTSDNAVTVHLVNASPRVQPDYSQQRFWREVAPGLFACNSYLTCGVTTA